MSTADKSQKTSARGSERHKIEKTPTKGDSRCRKSGGIRLPEIVNRTCIAGTTWTLADEAADLNREVEALAAGGSFAMDAHGGMFLQFLGMDGQRVFIAHLMAGHLRQAISMVATGAFECGMAEGRRKLGAQGRERKGLPPSVTSLMGWGISRNVSSPVMRNLLGIDFPSLRDLVSYLKAKKLPGIDGLHSFHHDLNSGKLVHSDGILEPLPSPWSHQKRTKGFIEELLREWPRPPGPRPGRPRKGIT